MAKQKIIIEGKTTRWFFGLDSKKNRVLHLRVMEGKELTIKSDMEYIVTDSNCDILQESANAMDALDVLDQEGYLWVTDREKHQYGRAICKRTKKAYDCKREKHQNLPQVIFTPA
jgi:hypothetical protein